MLRDCFSDEDEELEENEETTTVSSEETTANWRKRGFKRKRIKRPRSSSTEDRPTGGSMMTGTTDIQRNAPLSAPLLFIQLGNCGTQSGWFPQKQN